MIKLIVKCPNCGSTNTREWSTGRSPNNSFEIGFRAFSEEYYQLVRKEFSEVMHKDYDCYYAKNICDDCGKHFETRNRIKIEVIATEILED